MTAAVLDKVPGPHQFCQFWREQPNYRTVIFLTVATNSCPTQLLLNLAQNNKLVLPDEEEYELALQGKQIASEGCFDPVHSSQEHYKKLLCNYWHLFTAGVCIKHPFSSPLSKIVGQLMKSWPWAKNNTDAFFID